jgi:Vitamin B12 dependent methionine synthase, activation domain
MRIPGEPIVPDINKTGILIDPGDILRLLGDQNDTIDGHTKVIVNQYIEKSLEISSPRGAYLISDALLARSVPEITVSGITFHPGSIIQGMMNHSEKIALFMVTAGPDPEILARSLMEKGDYLEGYIADLVASSIVEGIAEQLEEHVRLYAEGHGMKITNRYSPGYCSWNVEEQQRLFNLFPENCCGISLSSSSLMSPVKSATGIIGIGAKVVYRDYTCEICTMRNCLFRKVRVS